MCCAVNHNEKGLRNEQALYDSMLRQLVESQV